MTSGPSKQSPAHFSATTCSEASPVSGRCSRRTLLKASATSFAMAAAAPKFVFASGSDRLRVGLVGCGSRGAGAASDCVGSNDGVELVAMGDLFKDRLDSSRNALKNCLPAGQFQVTDNRCFVGFDAYKDVIASDVQRCAACGTGPF